MDAISVDGMGPHLLDQDGGSQLANGNADKWQDDGEVCE
jgi:hypothetical protein